MVASPGECLYANTPQGPPASLLGEAPRGEESVPSDAGQGGGAPGPPVLTFEVCRGYIQGEERTSSGCLLQNDGS